MGIGKRRRPKHDDLMLLSGIALVIFPVLGSTAASAKEIALSFDDAPKADGHLYTGAERTRRVIEILKKHGIQTVFFSNSSKLGQSDGHERMRAYAEGGHIVANHTHSHPNLDKVSVERFLEDFDEADRRLRAFPTFMPWFRFPYLHEGPTRKVRDQVRGHLRTRGYRNGYVTVDNYDYFIDDLVAQARREGRKVDMEKACRMLVDLMLDGVRFYDEVALRHIGPVRHVLLMHENDLEAYCLDWLIAGLRDAGWTIVAPARAFQQSALAEEPDTLYLGQGRVAALAHVKSGIEYVSKWESGNALRAEFQKRRIAAGSKARPGVLR